MKLAYTIPAKGHTYKPDFRVAGKDGRIIIIETKGIFDTADRQKMRFVKEQFPDLDIRLIFSNANARIAKGSKTTYAMWADTHGYKWAHRHVPQEWISELKAQ